MAMTSLESAQALANALANRVKSLSNKVTTCNNGLDELLSFAVNGDFFEKELSQDESDGDTSLNKNRDSSLNKKNPKSNLFSDTSNRLVFDRMLKTKKGKRDVNSHYQIKRRSRHQLRQRYVKRLNGKHLGSLHSLNFATDFNDIDKGLPSKTGVSLALSSNSKDFDVGSTTQTPVFTPPSPTPTPTFYGQERHLNFANEQRQKQEMILRSFVPCLETVTFGIGGCAFSTDPEASDTDRSLMAGNNVATFPMFKPPGLPATLKVDLEVEARAIDESSGLAAAESPNEASRFAESLNKDEGDPHEVDEDGYPVFRGNVDVPLFFGSSSDGEQDLDQSGTPQTVQKENDTNYQAAAAASSPHRFSEGPNNSVAIPVHLSDGETYQTFLNPSFFSPSSPIRPSASDGQSVARSMSNAHRDPAASPGVSFPHSDLDPLDLDSAATDLAADARANERTIEGLADSEGDHRQKVSYTGNTEDLKRPRHHRHRHHHHHHYHQHSRHHHDDHDDHHHRRERRKVRSFQKPEEDQEMKQALRKHEVHKYRDKKEKEEKEEKDDDDNRDSRRRRRQRRHRSRYSDSASKERDGSKVEEEGRRRSRRRRRHHHHSKGAKYHDHDYFGSRHSVRDLEAADVDNANLGRDLAGPSETMMMTNGVPVMTNDSCYPPPPQDPWATQLPFKRPQQLQCQQ